MYFLLLQIILISILRQMKYKEYKGLNLPNIANEIGEKWEKEKTFKNSLKMSEGKPPFIFFEGPPSANGQPGIHHVMARAIKDIFCRYKTLKGFEVKRKAGWDTHGLPVEIGVEKTLGITKEDIGKTISVEEYNSACRTEVMKYKDLWDKLTVEMGYWVDLDDPYLTFDNKYIETLWYLLSKLYNKGLLYKGYTIQPFSPAAGTGLSTHELNQPGCYRDVKDTTATAQFTIIRDEKSEFLFDNDEDLFFMAWTTTPWTLPSNTALAVGPKIKYLKVKSYNPYTGKLGYFIIAKDLMNNYFNPKYADLAMEDYEKGSKKVPFEVVGEFFGKEFESINYQQLLPWIKPMGDAFRVVLGDFVTTEDGTGIVHLAPTFGADDDRVAKQSGIAPLILIDKEGNRNPMVDRRGRFFEIEDLDADFVEKYVDKKLYSEYAGRFVKNAYDPNLSEKDETLDVYIAIRMKESNRAFKIEKHTHSYPHCWRTDKPILYYPLDSWFIKTTDYRDRMIALNETINWKPKSTGEGRFGNWLKNLVDWNLSRSRYWGTPLPIWRTEDGTEEICIGSVQQLKEEIEKSITAGFMKESPLENFEPGNNTKENYNTFDLHRPYCDSIILVSQSGKAMNRETDLIDVWFDSGAMPYAQFHYPFENKEVANYFPADFIAEGVDQTRGWFFTLHAIATMAFDSVAYKNCISNGLVLDKFGNKMSKRLGNGVDPFSTINKYGPDALRWYLITNSQPWDNLKFDLSGITEVQRKFFGTLYNTYSFFAMYANIDGFSFSEPEISIENRPEIDRWILSELNSLIVLVDNAFESYEPTRAGRAIAQFVDERLSNWFVRLSRRRFWKGEYGTDKISAYQTLYHCLDVLSHLASPIAPFFCDKLFCDLNAVSGRNSVSSVHLSEMPVANTELIDKDLEERMQLAQKFSSMVLSLRKKHNLRVRQPLAKIMIPVLDKRFGEQVKAVEDLILSEVNVKSLELLTDTSGVLVKKIKANFKALGPKYGKMMKTLAASIAKMSQENIQELEKNSSFVIDLDGKSCEIVPTDVEITTEDIPGWVVATMDKLTVALDETITKELKSEGVARDIVNRIQSLRKEIGLEVTDKINVVFEKQNSIDDAVNDNLSYICAETLTEEFSWVDKIAESEVQKLEIADDVIANVFITKA